MRIDPALVALVCIAGCGASTPHVSEPSASRALAYEGRARAAASVGARQEALGFATRALVVRIAACGYDCPEVAYSFTQLGDLRLENAQPEWAAQSYQRAIEVLVPHGEPYASWLAALSVRRAEACARATNTAPACSTGDIRSGK